ncbi:MAG: PilN domain-containing protein [Gammaproteobacteria bacterium]|nr:PilN domain-containing protein [Gammaproteobacteria bacterium]
MPRVNLLDWRAERRRALLIEFGILLAIVALASIAVVSSIQYVLNKKTEAQIARNQYLQQEIAALDEKIKEIERLRTLKDALIARMTVIQELQSKRPEVVHLFDELVRSMPDGVHLTQLSQSGDTITLNGRAESNARVSSIMRNLDNSDWLGGTWLNVVQAEGDPIYRKQFTVRVKQMTKKADTASKDPEGVEAQ